MLCSSKEFYGNLKKFRNFLQFKESVYLVVRDLLLRIESANYRIIHVRPAINEVMKRMLYRVSKKKRYGN